MGVLTMSALGERGSNSHISESLGLFGAAIGVDGKLPSSSETSLGNSCPNLLEGLPIFRTVNASCKTDRCFAFLKKICDCKPGF